MQLKRDMFGMPAILLIKRWDIGVLVHMFFFEVALVDGRVAIGFGYICCGWCYKNRAYELWEGS